MVKILNNIANFLFLASLLGLTVAGVVGSFNQGWNMPQIVAANSAIMFLWSLLVGWAAIQAKKIS